MPIRPTAIKWILIGLVGALLLPYTLLNGVGLFVGVGRIRGALEIVVFVAPIFAFPLYLVSIWSTYRASLLIGLNFCVLHLGYFLIDWPHWGTLVEALRIDWPLLLSCILLYAAALQKPLTGAPATRVRLQ